MLGMTGLQVAEQLLALKPPLVVFATACDEHALKAFELAAVDYVLKPYHKSRLEATVARLRTALTVHDTQAMLPYLANIRIHKLWAARGDGTGVLLDYKQILWCNAADERVFVRVGQDNFLVKGTMTELETRLVPHGFAKQL